MVHLSTAIRKAVIEFNFCVFAFSFLHYTLFTCQLLVARCDSSGSFDKLDVKGMQV